MTSAVESHAHSYRTALSPPPTSTPSALAGSRSSGRARPPPPAHSPPYPSPSSPASLMRSSPRRDPNKSILILSAPTVVGKCAITEQFERLLGLDQIKAGIEPPLPLSPSSYPRPLSSSRSAPRPSCQQCPECPAFVADGQKGTCFMCNCPRRVHDFSSLFPHKNWVSSCQELDDPLYHIERSKPQLSPPTTALFRSEIDLCKRYSMVHEGYVWSPPGLSASKTEEWMGLLPDSKVPKLNSDGEKYREMQLRYQIPKQDLALKYCNHVEEKEKTSYENFINARNDIALDIGHAIDSIREKATCPKCQKAIQPGGLAVVAPKFGLDTFWHPLCFSCSSCDEILVDLTYCVFDDKIFCERHYAENLKPRCGSCDELIFCGEYTKALNKDWHCHHFMCCACQTVLTGQQYVLADNQQCCIPCFEQTFTNSCQSCQKKIGIESKDMAYQDMHWHEECFACQKCKSSLSGQRFAVKNHYIFCGSCYDSEFASRCDSCGEPFKAGTKRMDYKNRKWHEKCFQCVVCKVPVGTKPFLIPDESDVYCIKCFEDKFATKCTKCSQVMTTGGVTFKNEAWHKECFTCSHCNTILAGQKFASKEDKPYCAKCFGDLFAKRCTACSEPITGTGGTRFISFEGRHWHSDCFMCALCKLSMAGKGFITDGEDIICPDCAKEKLISATGGV